jgi:DNA-binding IclR family transcriptional regulator
LRARVRISLRCAVTPAELPSDVEQLLREHIRSIETLEILLWLREEPDRTWTIAEVYQKVRSSERSVSQNLEELSRRGLLRQEGQSLIYRFAPQTDALRATIDQLAHLYAERRVRIVEAIYSERVSEVDEFAKAFRLRKDPHG